MKRFSFTKHAEKRMRERDISDPNKLSLVLAKNKAKKYIVQNCPKNKYRNDHVYFRTNNKGARSVFVCKVLGLGEYLVVTAFKIQSNEANTSI